jgi:hypothetical protein
MVQTFWILKYRFLELPWDPKSPAQLFDCDRVHLGASVYNASRIVKLWGTVARKGDHIPERPHRLSRILELPERLNPVPLEQLEKMAATIEPPRSTHPGPDEPRGDERFDLEQYATRHLHAKKPEPHDGRFKWRVICPFNAEHDNAAVLRSAGGENRFPLLSPKLQRQALAAGPRVIRRPPPAAPIPAESRAGAGAGSGPGRTARERAARDSPA